MLRSLINWWNGRGSWRRAHNLAWEGSATPGADGLTEFQRMALAATKGAAGNISLDRGGTSETFLTGVLPGTNAVVFIYQDGAEVSGGSPSLRAERWDYQTPQSLIEELIAVVRANVQSNQPLHPTPSAAEAPASGAGERRR